MSLRTLSVVVFSVLLLGCIAGGGIDAVSAAKGSTQIQSFLAQHPNAKIVVLLYSGDQLTAALNQVPECASITAKSAYKVTFTDSGTNAVSFINPDNGQAYCVVVTSAQGQVVASVQPTASTNTQNPTASAPTALPAQPTANPTSGQPTVQETSVPTANPQNPTANPTASSQANPAATSTAAATTSANAQGQSSVSMEPLVDYSNAQDGYDIQKPASWTAEIVNDEYLDVKKDDNTDALIWPIQLQGTYQEMTGEGLGNYLIGLIKKQNPDFTPLSISVSPDKTSMEVVATVTVDGVALKGVFTTFVGENGHGLLTGYEAPINQFDQYEPTLRSIIKSYKTVDTDATKAQAVAEAKANGLPTAPSNPAASASTAIQLTPYTASDGSFSFQAPAGWKIDGLGSCSTRSMMAYDPNNPIRREFVIDSSTLALPVSQLTAENVLTEALPKISQYDSAFGQVSNIQIVGPKADYPAADQLQQAQGGVVDSGILTATMTIDGKPAKGAFGVVLNNPSLAMAPGFAYIIFSGGIADASDYDAVSPAMTQSIAGYTVSQNYANACSASNQADISRRTGDITKNLEDTSNTVMSGYENRQNVEDQVSQKWSDTTLGVDRVYSPTNDQVYQVPNNFYDNYDLNRQKFEMNDLQQLTPDQWTKYAPLDGAQNIR